MEKKAGGKVLVDGAYVQFLSNKGKLADNVRRFPAAFQEALKDAWLMHGEMWGRRKAYLARAGLQMSYSIQSSDLCT